MADEELLVTQGKAMREMREQGVVLAFPSGNYYRVRNPTAAGLLRRGNLPNILLTFVIDAFYNGASQEKVDKFLSAQEKEENVLALMESFAVICQEMLMEPRVVENAQADDEVTMMDIPLVDQLWAFNLTFVPAEELYPFRAQPNADVGSLPRLEDVPQAAQ